MLSASSFRGLLRRWRVRRYLSTLQRKHLHEIPFFIQRFFTPSSEWDELSEEMRASTLRRRYELSEILRNPCLVVLAEPGAGKSTWLHKALLHVIQEKGVMVPIYAALRDYEGNLQNLLKSVEGYTLFRKITARP